MKITEIMHGGIRVYTINYTLNMQNIQKTNEVKYNLSTSTQRVGKAE